MVTEEGKEGRIARDRFHITQSSQMTSLWEGRVNSQMTIETNKFKKTKYIKRIENIARE